MYFTDSLILHETIHQFHLLGRSGTAPLLWWYVKVCEHLSNHDWDGTCLYWYLPHINRSDYPQEALDELDNTAVNLNYAIQTGSELSRPMTWALFAYLDTFSSELSEDFSRLRFLLDESTVMEDPLASFSELIGEPNSLLSSLREWLMEVQLPFREVYQEWIGIGPQSIRGIGINFSLPYLKKASSTILCSQLTKMIGSLES